MQKEKNSKTIKEVACGFNYLLYQPEKFKEEKLPLIVFLHGAGERGSDLSLLKVHSLPQLFDTDESYPCIAVSPQCPENTFWTAQIQQLKVFIDEIILKYPVDEDRICLTGVSMGGYGTWHMAMAYPKLFAAIVPVCGGGMPWNAGILTMPVWAFHGEIDSVVSVRESIEMMEKLTKTNPLAKLTVFPKVDHNAWDYAYNNELIHWILQQKK